MRNRCYVKSVAQVSCQKPLSDKWLTEPETYDVSYVRAQEPDLSGFITGSEARRMSRILKRAIATAITAIDKSGHSSMDAIITGTGSGCMENSERFLIDMSRFGENCLKPTLFMQSTHNTISSLMAIVLKCHGYNNTYSHKGISFESALLDAWLQINSGELHTVLVGSHDEVTPMMSTIMFSDDPEESFLSEASVSAVVSSEITPATTLCEIESVSLLHRPDIKILAESFDSEQDGCMLLGTTGNPMKDQPYHDLISALAFSPIQLQYKPLFGENFSASAIGFYVGVTLLNNPEIPSFLSLDGTTKPAPQRITLINRTDDSDWAIIRLKKPDF